MNWTDKEAGVTYLVIDNGRPTVASTDLGMAKGFARYRAGEGAYWQHGIDAATDKLWTNRGGVPYWTGWEVRSIPTL